MFIVMRKSRKQGRRSILTADAKLSSFAIIPEIFHFDLDDEIKSIPIKRAERNYCTNQKYIFLINGLMK